MDQLRGVVCRVSWELVMGRSKRSQAIFWAIVGGVISPPIFLLTLGFSTLSLVLAVLSVPLGIVAGWRSHDRIERLWRDVNDEDSDENHDREDAPRKGDVR